MIALIRRPDPTIRPPEGKQTMRYRTRVTAPAALLGTVAALSVASPAHADPETGTPGPETLDIPAKVVEHLVETTPEPRDGSRRRRNA